MMDSLLAGRGSIGRHQRRKKKTLNAFTASVLSLMVQKMDLHNKRMMKEEEMEELNKRGLGSLLTETKEIV